MTDFEDTLQPLYEKAERLNHENPYELSLKIEMYTEILLKIAEYISLCTYQYGKAYSKRKKEYGLFLSKTKGTQQQKSGRAEKWAYPYRLKEAEAESELVKWKYTYDATKEQIQAMKRTLDVLQQEMRGGH